MEKKPIGFKAYKEWKHEFETELVYTRKDLAEHGEAIRKALRVSRIIMETKAGKIAMQIVDIRETPEGVVVTIK